MIRECKTLQEDESVIFLRYCDIKKEKIPEVGCVVNVNLNNDTVCVSWMDGYKDRKDDIPFKDMLAVFNLEGENVRFGNISGPSDLLVPDFEHNPYEVESEDEYQRS